MTGAKPEVKSIFGISVREGGTYAGTRAYVRRRKWRALIESIVNENQGGVTGYYSDSRLCVWHKYVVR